MPYLNNDNDYHYFSAACWVVSRLLPILNHDSFPLLLSAGIDRYVLVVFELAFPAKILRKALCPARGGFLALFYVFAIEIA